MIAVRDGVRPRARWIFVGAAALAAALAFHPTSTSADRPPAARSASAIPPAPAGALEFLAVGDWGRGNRAQRQVADAMAAWADARPVRFVVSTGDNFYPNGVSSVTDRKWTSSFEDVYGAKSLQVPWIVALGNHDYRGNVDAEIEYSARSARWRMPERSFAATETLADRTRLEIFVLDTSPFLGTYRSIFSLTKVAGQDPAVSLAWLERGLAASTAEWKIVVGHHPILSCGPHGDSKELVRDVQPLLARHRVAIYLNGHEHGLQHLRSGGVDFLTSGGGSDTVRVSPDARTVWAAETRGFMAFTVTAETIRVAAVDAEGRILHEAMIQRPHAR